MLIQILLLQMTFWTANGERFFDWQSRSSQRNMEIDTPFYTSVSPTAMEIVSNLEFFGVLIIQ